MDESRVDPAIERRRTCGALWLGVLAMGIAGLLGRIPQLLAAAWLGTVVMMIGTAATARLSSDERLVHPGPYRLVAGALLAVSLAGSIVAFVPEASGLSQWYAVFFMPVAVLAYRAVVARGPRCGVGTAAIALWLWLPLVALANLGCRPRNWYLRVPHWTETVSEAAVLVTAFLAAALAAAALLAFRRRDPVPEARVA